MKPKLSLAQKLFERVKALPASVKAAGLFGISTAVLLLILIWNLLLPYIVEKRVQSYLSVLSGVLNVDVAVHSISLYHADLSLDLYQDAEHTVKILHAGEVELYYSPTELLCGRFRDAGISGLELPIYFRKDGLHCPVFDLLTSGGKDLWSGFVSCFPRGAGKKLSGEFRLFHHNESERIPFSGELLHPEHQWSYVKGLLTLEPECGKVQISGEYDAQSKTLHFKADGNDLLFELPLYAASSLLKKEKLNVRSTFSADGAIDTGTWELTRSGALLNTNIHLLTPSVNTDLDTEINWLHEGSKRELLVSGVSTEWNGVPIRLDSLSFMALPTPEKGNGIVNILKDGFQGSFRLNAGSRASFPVKFQCRPEQEGLTFSMSTDTTSSRGRQILAYQNMSIETTDPEFELNITASETRFDAILIAKASSVMLSNGKDSVFVPKPSFEGSLSMSKTENRAWHPDLTAGVILDGAILEYEDIKATCHKLVLSGEKQDGKTFSCHLKLDHGEAELPALGIRAEAISANLPVLFPLNEMPETAGKGCWSIADIQKNGISLGSLSGKAEIFRGPVFHISGKGTAPIQQFSFQGKAGHDACGWFMNAGFEFPEQVLQPHAGLAEFFPRLKEFTITGKLQAKGNYSYASGLHSVKGKIDLHDLNITNGKLGLTADGGEISLTRSDDAALNSSVRFNRIACEKVNIGTTEAVFSYFPKNGWSMDRFRSNWCDGMVRIDPANLNPAAGIHTELHCEKLDLADFLRQTGFGNVSGKGKVNGTIPVSWEAGKGLIIKDGLLFSAPDENGELRGSLDAALAGGDALPPEMALAQDALCDFTYSWTRLTMNADGKDLQMVLQFDGKPNVPLYFEYKSNTGFQRSRTPHNFQHLKLDVNAKVRLQLTQKVTSYFSNLYSQKKDSK